MKLLEPIGNNSVVEMVINRITNSIITGELKKGSKIPTELELSEHLNVARNSVREAIKVLVYLGVLEIRRAEGTFVTSGFSDKMLNPLLYSLILEDGNSSNIIELRNMFEVSILKVAIKNSTEEDIQKIENRYEELKACLINDGHNYEEILHLDIEFHKAIEEATHNPLILRISSVITMLTIPSRLETIQNIITSGDLEFLIESHRSFLEIIKEQDAVRIIDAVDASYAYWKTTFSSR